MSTASSLVPAEQSKVFASSSRQVHLLELYSSEGCSSCPPAEAWLGSLRAAADLWKAFVPVAFHVDYWNGLGWPDRFSQADFTARQRRYASSWHSESVYTPEFVLNGQEWRQAPVETLSQQSAEVGELKATQNGARRFTIEFHPREKSGRWVAYGVLLGDSLETKVGGGENGGRVLHHEFVALAWDQAEMKGSVPSIPLDLSRQSDRRAPRYSVAFWVSRPGSQKPVQAVGGDLE